MNFVLIVHTPDDHIETVRLESGHHVIGSGNACDLRLPFEGVGARHAELIVDRTTLPIVRELESVSGVYVNERRVDERALRPGDIVRISRCEILVQEEEGQEHRGPSGGYTEEEESIFFEIKVRLHQALIQRIDLRRVDDAILRTETERIIRDLMREMDQEIPAFIDRGVLLKQMLEDALGLGPLEDLMADVEVTEIMVNRRDQVYVERFGRLEKSDKKFLSDEQVLNVIQRIVAPLGRGINEARPMVDARLPDGSRVNAIIAPLSVTGPTLTIRKFSKIIFDISDLVGNGTLSWPMAQLLRVCVENKRNIIISGGTGSGKTTLLNILGSFIPPGERVVTVEDAVELSLPQEHLVSLEVRPANLEGVGEVTFRDLVINSLRMRPDRVIVGECRGGEAIDMLQAMNTGHEGSLTTVHSNSPRDAISRLETMVLMSGLDLPSRAIREQIASAINMIVQTQRFSDGTRKVTRVTEIVGIKKSNIILHDLFRFCQEGVARDKRVRGKFVASETIPKVVLTMREQGVDAPWDAAVSPGEGEN